MKLRFCILSLCLFAQTLFSAQPTVTLAASTPSLKVSPRLYGLMTEEINFSYDGGLYGELVRNRAFLDSVYGPDHWFVSTSGSATVKHSLDATNPLNEQIAMSLRVEIAGTLSGHPVGVTNEGYWGIPLRPNTTYKGSFFAKASTGGPSSVTVALVSTSGTVSYAQAVVTGITGTWARYEYTLTTGTLTATSDARLFVGADTPGSLWLGVVSLFPPTWKNRTNGLRPDLMQKLVDLKPKFLRFPGGNYLEGNTPEQRFQWKNTIGPIEQRPGHLSPWGYRSTDGMGLLEFLLWCEDMGAEPVLAVYAGYALNGTHTSAGSALTPFVQEALDEIEYLTGDTTTTWGARRAADGHPAPFTLHYVEIGNEDFFDTSGSYDGRYTQFYDAIKAKYPQLKLISSIGNEQSASLRVKSRTPDVLDEHYYRSTAEFIAAGNQFEAYTRTGKEIFVGEWAAHEDASIRPWDAAAKTQPPTPSMKAAIGDGVWMAAMERNSDLVTMQCYAPLFVNVNSGAWQWRPDLIGYNALTSFGAPSYHALAMFSRNVGDELLKFTTANTTIQGSATRDSSTGRLFVKLVNPASSSVALQLALGDGVSYADSGTAITLAADPAATNSITAPNVVLPSTTTIQGISNTFTYTVPANAIVVLIIDKIAPLTFTLQPTSQNVLPGGTVSFQATVSDATTYQWQKDGVNISGATASTLTLSALTAAANGAYTLVAGNATGQVTSAKAQLLVTTTISIDTTLDRVPISPYIYGKNLVLSDSPGSPLTQVQWQFLRDAGVRMCRENGGNNATKYNWQTKLSSHPDWYNNVYAHDWDFAVTSLQANLPGVQGVWAFQLLGKSAGNTSNNFDDWGYNRSQWWAGVSQNLAGGGVPNTTGGGHALTEGTASKYLVDWPADATVGILDHWIKPSGLGLDRSGFRYWSMDNEPEIWNSTHDDVMPVQLSAEDFVQRYFSVAKKARAKFPEIRLMGPVPANEWQWYNWATSIVGADGKHYCWLEYFIKRVAEEQAATGIRLLDVLDIHYYPGSKDPATILQFHRTYFDRNYVHPEANGVHSVTGTYNSAENKEYILARCQDWLTQYVGKNHGIGVGVSETGIALDNAPVTAVWYASTLGEFMRNGGELFTPWSWQNGMYEVLHLFSRYNYDTSVRATSADDTLVSSYTTVDDTTGNMTVVLVNRELTATRTVNASISGTQVPDGVYQTLRLANLPAKETFVSHSNNALAQGTVSVSSNMLVLDLPPLSVTTVLLKRVPDVTSTPAASETRLVNLSVRAHSSKGSGVLTIGLFVSGSGTKEILFRGTGPALIPLGVTNTLPNPVLTLFGQNQTVLQSNDNWGNSSTSASLLSISNKLGAFALADNSLDSAMLASFPAGGFTVEVSDKDGNSGDALGEAFEIDKTSAARLVNISGRASVGANADELIAGFVIAGPGSKQVLIRAVGPGLTQYGVPGVLADPVLRVFRAGCDTPVYRNDNWSELAYSGEVSKTLSNLNAFSLAADSKDSALLLTLPPGQYTAVVSGAGGTTGIGLVEVYEVK